jgi:hypothetical protein
LLFTEGKSKTASVEETSASNSTQNKEDSEEEDTDFVDLLEDSDVEDTEDFSSNDEKGSKIDATELSDLAEDLKTTMSISSKKYNMGFQNPYIMYQYVEDGNQLVSVDVLVPSVHRRFIRPSIHSSGMYFDLGIAVPEFFWNADRLVAANKEHTSFNKNTHKATAFQQAAKKIQEDFNTFETEEVLSGAQRFKLPFKVEPDYYTGDGGEGWEVQIFDNEDTELYDELDGEVMSFFVLSVNLVSVEKPRQQKRKGTMRRIGSPLAPGRAGAGAEAEEASMNEG